MQVNMLRTMPGSARAKNCSHTIGRKTTGRCGAISLARSFGQVLNLPGWCWAEIQQLALVGSSSSLHSEACNALGASDGVIHSSISLEVVSLRAATNNALGQTRILNAAILATYQLRLGAPSQFQGETSTTPPPGVELYPCGLPATSWAPCGKGPTRKRHRLKAPVQELRRNACL